MIFHGESQKKWRSDFNIILKNVKKIYINLSTGGKSLKKIKKLLMGVLMGILLCAAVPSVYQNSFSTKEVQAASKVAISSKKVYLIKGKTTTLKLLNAKGKVKWSSDKKNIATVSSKGIVKAQNQGTAIIKAVNGKKSYKCTVIVEVPKMSKTSVSLDVGENYQLKVNGTKQKVTWKSSNKSIATVSSKGKVSAKKTGKATITAAVGGKKYTSKITVKKRAVTTPSSTPELSGTERLKNYIITYGNTDSDGNKFIAGSYVDWSDTTYQYYILYDGSANCFEFAFLGSLDEVETDNLIQMKLNMTPTIAYPEYIFLYRDGVAGYAMRAELVISMYDSETDIMFKELSSPGYEERPYASKNRSANNNLREACRDWNKLLGRAGLSLRDLGFISYNG